MTSPDIPGLDIDRNGHPIRRDPNVEPWSFRLVRVLIFEGIAILIALGLNAYVSSIWAITLLFVAVPAGIIYTLMRRHYSVADNIHI
jgi:uncharacterized membrane-anchored protein